MTPYQQALAVLQKAYDAADPGARRLCADKIDQAAASGDMDLINKLAAALPSLGALAAAYDAAPETTREAFAEELDDARISLNVAAIDALAAMLKATP